MIPIYNSPGDAARAWAKRFPRAATSTRNDKWIGGNAAETLQAATSGGTSGHVKAAEAVMAQLQDAMPASWRDAWTMAPAGAFPLVPAVLAGDPDCMFRRVQQERENHPVKIVVVLTSSNGIPNSILIKRGVACLALAMALQAVRGCELYVATTLGGSANYNLPYVRALGGGVALCRIPSDPLSVTEACFALTHGGVGRGILAGLCADAAAATPLRDDATTGMDNWSSMGTWPRKMDYDKPEPFLAILRDQLGFEHDAVMVGPATMHHGDAISRDPVAWVRATLARYLTQD